MPRIRLVLIPGLVVLLALYIADDLLSFLPEPFGTNLYYVVMFAAAFACVARAVMVRHERLAWALMGAGLVLFAAGDLYWKLFLENLDNPPAPSPADIGWLGYYPLTYASLALLIRSRLPRASAAQWSDGVLAALATAAVSSALVLRPIIDSSLVGSLPAKLANLAYPAGDLVLVGFGVCAIALTGWRPDRAWSLLIGCIVANAIGDFLYLRAVAEGTYYDGSFIDLFWPISAVLVTLAAWQSPQLKLRPPGGTRVLAVPAVALVAAVAVLVIDHYDRVYGPAIWLAAATLLVAVGRGLRALRENHLLLTRSRREALTDVLTGLGNRRRLLDDLDAALRDPRAGTHALALIDLDGFKAYNDTFGHAGGDALLARIGGRLAAAVDGDGRAYRMGGDEFCVLIRTSSADLDGWRAAIAAAIVEHGDGFAISGSYGSVLLPTETTSSSEALRLADERMYRHKAARASAPVRDRETMLLDFLREREPGLHAHVGDVAELAVAVGERLGLEGTGLDLVRRGAELHDIGKLAIPEAILNKPGRLDDDEWEFMRRHTLIGAALLSGTPVLDGVARVVRSSHERWDGAGYPDGLIGAAIPLESRIIFACDAFDAMTTDRVYRPGRPVADALAELRRCSGTQFDPSVVAALAAVVAEREAALIAF